MRSRGLEQVHMGRTAMHPLHLRCPQAIFSHETALFFHDLTDREPLAYSITVKTGYNPIWLKHEGFQVLYY